MKDLWLRMDRAFLGQSSDAQDGSRLSPMEALRILKDAGTVKVGFWMMDDLLSMHSRQAICGHITPNPTILLPRVATDRLLSITSTLELRALS